jgi:hypothetical protein
MKPVRYLIDKWSYLISCVLAVVLITFFLLIININSFTVCFIDLIIISSFLLPLFLEYIRKNIFYKGLNQYIDELDKKYLLSELIEEPDFLEGKIFYDILKKSNKSMNDEIHKYLSSTKEYKEYIEMWVHEIKTPIAAAKLMERNTPDNGNRKMIESLDSIDNYVEKVLFYAKSSVANRDYIIKSVNLKDVVSSSLRKNSVNLIQSKVKIVLDDIDYQIYTDIKWIEFIIGQIIGNSIKYMNKYEKNLIFMGYRDEGRIILKIQDNGIGISEKDLRWVFDKGFTGENGRKYAKSTGIGLYLCKSLCDKLGIQIGIESVEGESTTLELVFPESNIRMLES